MNTESNSLSSHLKDPERLAALRAVALLDTPAEIAFDRLSRLAAQFAKAPVALVSLVDADRQFFKSCIGLPEPWKSRRETPLSHSFCQHNRIAKKPLIITDAREHPLFRDNPAIQDLSVIAYLGIPLISPDGHVLGSFCVIDTKPRSWTEKEVETVTDLAAAVMNEIHLRTEIVQRQQAEKKRDELAALNASLLDESRASYQTLFEQSPYGIVIADADSYYIDANASVCRMLGYTRDEMIGLHAADIVADTEIEHIEAALREIKSQSEYFRVWRFRRKDGSFFNAEVSATTMPDGHLLGIIRDITEIKQAERRAVHERNLSDQVINSMPGLVYLFDQEGRFLRWNRQFRDATGYTDDELSRLHPLKLFLGPDRDLIAERIQTGFETGQSNAEAELVSRDGQKSPYFFTGSRIEYEGRTCLIGMGINIVALKSAQAALKESERRFRDLVALLPVTVFETDPEYQLSFANQHAYGLFGYSEKELQQGINAIDLIDPKDHARVMANIAKRLKGENPGTIEYEAIKKDGSRFPMLLQANTMTKDGRFAGMRGIIIDISDRKQQEEERQEISTQLRQAQKMESIGRLAGGVSHDLNNMLSPIIGYAELLLFELKQDDTHREHVNQIRDAGLRAKNIVHQLLAFSRKQNLEYKPANLDKVLTNFEKLLRRTIREDIDIQIRTSTPSTVIMADAGQLEQVVMNLAVNAQDAMPNGGKLVLETGIADLDEAYARVHPGVTPGQYAVLSVSDSGTGMNAETRELLFEPFFSTKGDRGTGLGLATVYGIVKQHQGNIWVYSEKGMGSTFKIYLPLPRKVSSGFEATQKIHTAVKGSETILIAEDNEQVRILAHDILERQGYTVLLAKNGADAIEVLSGYKHPVHLLLTDVVMPEMNGKELYSLAAKKLPDLKVLFMSGYTDDIISHHGILENGVQFIQKPLSVDILLSKVREILDKT